MSDTRRKRKPLEIALEVGLFLIGLSCFLVACSGGPVFLWFVGLILASVGLALDPDGGC
jgi:hypothetical protein